MGLFANQPKMTSGLIERQTSIFAREEWLQLPWVGREKSLAQKIYDAGFCFSSLTVRGDRLLTRTDGSAIHLRKLLIEVDALRQNINSLHDSIPCHCKLLSCSSSPVFDTDRTIEISDDVVNDNSHLIQCGLLSGLTLACFSLMQILRESSRQYGYLESQFGIEDFYQSCPLEASKRDKQTQGMLIRGIIEASIQLRHKIADPGTINRLIWSLQVAKSQAYHSQQDSILCEELLKQLTQQKMRYVGARLQSGGRKASFL